MSNPEAVNDGQAASPDLPAVPEEQLLAADDAIRGTFSFGGDQPETQGEDPLEVESGDDGEGDLAPGDDPERSGLDAPRDLRGAAE